MSVVEWIATLITVGSFCGIVAAGIHAWCREPDEEHHCWQCRRVTCWRDNECRECRWAEDR